MTSLEERYARWLLPQLEIKLEVNGIVITASFNPTKLGGFFKNSTAMVK